MLQRESRLPANHERVRGHLSQENFDRSRLAAARSQPFSARSRLASCLIECLEAFPAENRWRFPSCLSLITRPIARTSRRAYRREPLLDTYDKKKEHTHTKGKTGKSNNKTIRSAGGVIFRPTARSCEAYGVDARADRVR